MVQKAVIIGIIACIILCIISAALAGVYMFINTSNQPPPVTTSPPPVTQQPSAPPSSDPQPPQVNNPPPVDSQPPPVVSDCPERLDCTFDRKSPVIQNILSYFMKESSLKDKYIMIPMKSARVNNTQCDVLYTYLGIPPKTTDSGQDYRRFTMEQRGTDKACWKVKSMGAPHSGSYLART